jgi:thiol-disulfide isomerase/thioredoxin
MVVRAARSRTHLRHSLSGHHVLKCGEAVTICRTILPNHPAEPICRDRHGSRGGAVSRLAHRWAAARSAGMTHIRHLLPILLLAPLSALDVGETAPALDGVTWVQGDPVASTGGVTVVEFWASWCGPCRTTVPHLAELQAQYPTARIVGISQEDEAAVAGFLKETPAMTYRVGRIDASGHDAWMGNDNGIPHAFVLNTEGVVLWEGHPGQMDAPLAAIVGGTYDVATQLAVAEDQRALEAAVGGDAPDLPAAKAAIARLLARDPVDERAVNMRVAIARHENDQAGVRAFIAALPLDRMGADHANQLAWDLATDDDLEGRHLDLALRLVDRSLTLDPGDARAIDTRARILFHLGLVELAIAEQERAAAADPEDKFFSNVLAHYRQVLVWRQALVPGTPPPAAAKPIEAPVP